MLGFGTSPAENCHEAAVQVRVFLFEFEDVVVVQDMRPEAVFERLALVVTSYHVSRDVMERGVFNVAVVLRLEECGGRCVCISRDYIYSMVNALAKNIAEPVPCVLWLFRFLVVQVEYATAYFS